MTFKESLEKHILDKGLNKEKLKELLELRGFNGRSIESYFRSKTPSEPTAKMLRELARILDLSMDKTYDYDYVDTGQRALRFDLRQLLDILESLDEEDLDTAKKMLEILGGKDKYFKKGGSAV